MATLDEETYYQHYGILDDDDVYALFDAYQFALDDGAENEEMEKKYKALKRHIVERVAK